MSQKYQQQLDEMQHVVQMFMMTRGADCEILGDALTNTAAQQLTRGNFTDLEQARQKDELSYRAT